MRYCAKIASLLASTAMIVAMNSCSDDPYHADEYINVICGGKTYSGMPTKYDKDGSFIFMDEELSKTYNTTLKTNPALSINIVDETTIELYASLEENLAAHGIDAKYIPEGEKISSGVILPDDEQCLATIELFSKEGFKGHRYEFGIKQANKPMSINDLQKTYLFDNECSSIRIHNNMSEYYVGELETEAGKIDPENANLVLVCYTQNNYTGPTYTFIQSPSSQKEYSSLINLNDKLSSFKLFIAPSQKTSK